MRMGKYALMKIISQCRKEKKKVSFDFGVKYIPKMRLILNGHVLYHGFALLIKAEWKKYLKCPRSLSPCLYRAADYVSMENTWIVEGIKRAHILPYFLYRMKQ